jgi:PAS domain S-box-containing protein
MRPGVCTGRGYRNSRTSERLRARPVSLAAPDLAGTPAALSSAFWSTKNLARAIDRLIELDEQESLKQREQMAFLSLMDSVIEALPDGLVVTDIEGNVILFNEKAEFMFGYHRSEIIGQKVEKLLPEQIRALHIRRRDLYNRFDIAPHAKTMGLGLHLTGIRSDGHEFPADITLARMVVPRGIFNIALVRYSPRIPELLEPATNPPDQEPESRPRPVPEFEVSDAEH